MGKSVKNIIIIVLGILFIGLGFYFVYANYIQYGIVTITFDVVYWLFAIIYLINQKNPTKAYESSVKSILKTYDSILVRNKEIPNLENRNIIIVYEIEDLINAQVELRRPICYIKQTESCSFILLDSKEAWVYIEKLNDDVVSPIDIEIKNAKRSLQSKSELDPEVLEEIERTTIIKLPNSKSYKISPIRQKDDKEKEDKKKKETVKEEKIEENKEEVEEKETPEEKTTYEEEEII